MEIYNFVIFLISIFLDMRPKVTISPKGKEKTKVKINISTETNMPSLNFVNKTDQLKEDTP